MIRAFAAIALPDEVRARLELLQHMLPGGGKVAVGNMHLTLVFLGEQPDAVLEAAHEGFAAIRAAPFALSLAGVDTFGGAAPRLVHVPVAPSDALAALQARVARAAQLAGAAPEHRRYLPHVTLARTRPRGPDLMRLEQAVAGLANFHAGPFEVRDFRLYRSDLGGGPARYTELARYPFAGAAGAAGAAG